MGSASEGAGKVVPSPSSWGSSVLKPRRASSDRALPRLLPFRSASARATAKTSSSIVTVVRISASSHHSITLSRWLTTVGNSSKTHRHCWCTIGGMFSDRAADMVLRARRREYDGLLIVGIVFLSSALTIGATNYAFGLYVKPLQETFGWSRTEILGSLSFWAIGSLTAPLLGRFMDNYGARPLLAGSLAVFGLSLVLRPMMTGALALLRSELPSVLRLLRDEHAPGGQARRAVVPEVEGPRHGLHDDGQQLRRPDRSYPDRVRLGGCHVGLGIRRHGTSGLRDRALGLPLRP